MHLDRGYQLRCGIGPRQWNWRGHFWTTQDLSAWLNNFRGTVCYRKVTKSHMMSRKEYILPGALTYVKYCTKQICATQS